MPTHTADPPLVFLADYRVGKPVAHPAAAAMRDGISHLFGHNVHAVAASAGLPGVTGAAIRYAYMRSPGVSALRVTVALNQTTAAASCTVSVTLTAPPLVVGDGVTTALDLPFTEDMGIGASPSTKECPTAAERTPSEYTRTFNVGGLDTDTIYDVTVLAANVSGTSKGVHKVTIEELPVASLYPEVVL
jgi:hypothetical protein